jgi:RNA polymerase sigma-70 factor (ECF subfamily)
MSDASRRQRDQKWLEGVRHGDEAAFEALFLAYYEKLCQYAARYISSHDVVEDLVQDVFLSLWRRRSDLRSELDVRPYLYKAVRNEALKYLNRQRVRKRPDTQQRLDRQELEKRLAQAAPDEELEHQEFEAAVQAAIETLPERRREIFNLSRRNDLTYSEIAELLDISVKTVETQMGRALRFLEKHLSRFLTILL